MIYSIKFWSEPTVDGRPVRMGRFWLTIHEAAAICKFFQAGYTRRSRPPAIHIDLAPMAAYRHGKHQHGVSRSKKSCCMSSRAFCMRSLYLAPITMPRRRERDPMAVAVPQTEEVLTEPLQLRQMRGL